MNITWEEYENAKSVVITFEKERKRIKELRSTNKYIYPTTFNIILYNKRKDLCELQYEVMNLPKSRRDELGEEFLNGLINEKRESIHKVMANKYKTEEI